MYMRNNRLKRMRNFREYVSDGSIEKYQQMADESAQYFIDAVKLKRPFVSEEALKGNYIQQIKQKVGLIDGIGSLDYAKSRIISLLNNY